MWFHLGRVKSSCKEDRGYITERKHSQNNKKIVAWKHFHMWAREIWFRSSFIRKLNTTCLLFDLALLLINVWPLYIPVPEVFLQLYKDENGSPCVVWWWYHCTDLISPPLNGLNNNKPRGTPNIVLYPLPDSFNTWNKRQSPSLSHSTVVANISGEEQI